MRLASLLEGIGMLLEALVRIGLLSSSAIALLLGQVALAVVLGLVAFGMFLRVWRLRKRAKA